MRACLAIVLAMTVLPAQPAPAQTVTGIDTALTVEKPCRIVKDDGQVGDYTLARCPGLAGAAVYTEASNSHVSLSFQWGKAKTGDVVSGYSLGDKLEWRGIRDKHGFAPHAVIVRIVVRDDNMRDDGTFETYNVLGVIRMEKRDACIMAVIDEAANLDALALARKTADTEAPQYACRKDLEIKTVGKPTRWTRKALGYDGEPPK